MAGRSKGVREGGCGGAGMREGGHARGRVCEVTNMQGRVYKGTSVREADCAFVAIEAVAVLVAVDDVLLVAVLVCPLLPTPEPTISLLHILPSVALALHVLFVVRNVVEGDVAGWASVPSRPLLPLAR